MTLLHYRIEAQKALEASSAKSLFLSNMSHEFRTPLNAVLGMGELIRMTDDLSLIQNYTDEIITAGQSLLHLVDGLIEYSNTGEKPSGNEPGIKNNGLNGVRSGPKNLDTDIR
jgi:signal transduction histidine kinase